MADISRCLPLTRASVQQAHERIKPFIHLTPVTTCTTLSRLASTPQSTSALIGTPYEGQKPAEPKINLYFKCENQQKIGAFKARGANHALSRLTEEELERGVITHSSGNHAQALALAAATRNVTAHIVMPTISTPSKIAATKGYGANVTFSGSTEDERVKVVKEVQQKTGAILVPPYDHPDIILGQGTMGLEFEAQVEEMLKDGNTEAATTQNERTNGVAGKKRGLDAVITPCGGGGMLSGVATALAGTGIRVFGAEPNVNGTDDCVQGLRSGERVTRVKTLTIADGLRTPVGAIPWAVISDPTKVTAVYGVSEEQIKAALKLAMERMKVFIEPSAAVGLAVVLYHEEFRQLVENEAGEEGWNVGIVLSGGNTTMEAIAKLFEVKEEVGQREEGVLGAKGEKVAENAAG
ncbi:MAG: hypothetical protein M1822_000420 [Bathelium mastoideum]|nr:MAG: hypothetical protein M1822_000420 [Bathelium mastoideum]